MKTITLLFIVLAAGLANSHAQDTWTQKADFGGTARRWATGFSIGSKGYIGTGQEDGYIDKNDFWEYDPSADAWTQKADFGGAPRISAVGFSIGSKGYIGTGEGVAPYFSYKNDFWEYDPVSNTWAQKADFGGTARYLAVGFSIGSKGYIGTGFDGTHKNDFWEYDPSTDAWIQKADFGGTARERASGFSIGSKGYLGWGWDPDFRSDFWEYDPATNGWTQKAGTLNTFIDARGFSIGNKGYLFHTVLWEYNPSTDSWIQKATLGTFRSLAVVFSIGLKGYAGTGGDFDGYKNDFWEYSDCTPEICNGLDDDCDGMIDDSTATISPSGTVSSCKSTDVTFTANSGAGLTYQWLKSAAAISGATNQAYTTNKKADYTVMVTDPTTGCSNTSAITTLAAGASPSATITPLGDPDICQTGSVVLQANSGTGLTYQWKNGNSYLNPPVTTQSYTATAKGTYKVEVSSGYGCTKLSTGAKVTNSCRMGDEQGSTAAESSDELRLYPNPAYDNFRIEFILPEGVNNAQIQVISMLGQIVFNEKAESTNVLLQKEIQINNAVPGIYFVRVITGDQILCKKIEIVQ